MHKRLSLVIPVLAAALGMTAAGQTAPNWDTSGNGMLNGTYYFRHVFWFLGDDYGDLGEGVSVYGTITFNSSAGTYQIMPAQAIDTNSSATTPQNFTGSGSYSISASGYGFMDSEYVSGDSIYGLVSNGVFIGSSTETGDAYDDLFIATPLASPAPTLSSLNGTYTIFGIDNPEIGQSGNIYGLDYEFTFTANGSGKITAVNAASGFIAGNGGAQTSQSIGQITYSASNGAFQLQFGGSLNGGNLIAGGHFMYMSPDGNFIFGGSPNGWDMFVGVRTSGGSQNFSGLYYEAGLDNDVAALSSYGYSTPDSYYGSLVAGNASYLYHQRLANAFNGPYDYTADDPLTSLSGGATEDPYNLQIYAVSTNGTYRVGWGQSPFLGIEVAVQVPPFSGSGVYINPTGIQNGGNSALFTAGIAPGAVILINGSGFSSGNASSPAGATLKTNLGGTQVMIDGIAAPLLYVTPTLIAAQVPFEVADNTGPPIVGIQVVTSSGSSKVITLFQNDTQPGIWTTNETGVGTAAVYHILSNGAFSPVTSANPAVAGETLVAYVNGLGTTSPAVGDGVPDTVQSSTNFQILADLLDPTYGYIYGAADTTTTPCTAETEISANGVWGDGCPVVFSGLAPPYAGLYQVNFVMPSGDGFGDPLIGENMILELQGLDSSGSFVETYTSQATIAVQGAAATAVRSPAANVRSRSLHPVPAHRSLRTHRAGRVIPRGLAGNR